MEIKIIKIDLIDIENCRKDI